MGVKEEKSLLMNGQGVVCLRLGRKACEAALVVTEEEEGGVLHAVLRH